MNKKEEAKRCMIVLLGVMLLLMVLLSSYSVADQSGVRVDIGMDKKVLGPDDSIRFAVRTYISDVLVLSVPMKLIVTDPSDEKHDISLIGHTNGDYIGSFKPGTPGLYNVEAIVTIDGRNSTFRDSFTVLSGTVDFGINVSDTIYYTFGPLNINGSVWMEDKDAPIKGEAELYLASESSPFYQALCNVPCNGECRFSCTLSKNIELGDYYILARTKYKNRDYTTKDTFRVDMQQSRNLSMNLSVDAMYFINDTAVISLFPELNHEPVSGAMINIRITGPGFPGDNLLADEILPGQYRYSFVPAQAGNYSLEATLVKGAAFGRAVANFTVVKKPAVTDIEHYSIARDISTGNQWMVARLNLTPGADINYVRVDGLKIKDQINYSSMHFMIDNRLVRAEATPEGIVIRGEALAGLDDPRAVFEAELLNKSGSITGYDVLADGNTRYVSINSSSHGMVRLSLDIPEASLVKYVLDSGYNLVDDWAQANDTVLLYGQSRSFIIYLRLLKTRMLPVTGLNLSYIELGGRNVPYLSHLPVDMASRASMTAPSAPSEAVYSHYFVEIRSISIDKKTVLQGDSATLKLDVASLDNFTSRVSIFYPNGTLLLESGFYDSIRFSLKNDTPLGSYTIIATSKSKAGGNISDTAIMKFNVFSSLPFVSIEGNQSSEAVRNSHVFYRHTVTNNNYKDTDVVNLDAGTNFTTVLFFEPDGKTMLEDTNHDGLRDTGVLMPGESREIIVEVIVPPNIAIGSVDEARITAVSSMDSDARASATDRTTVVAYKEERAKATEDIGIVSVDELEKNIVVTVKNNDVNSHIFSVMLTEDDGSHEYNETKDVLIAGSETQKIVYPLKIGGLEYTATARLLDTYYTPYADADMQNNFRRLVVNKGWWNESFRYRIPFAYKETLHQDHDVFTVRLYAVFNPGADMDNIQVVYYDGSSYRNGWHRFLTFDSGSGFVILGLGNISANTDGTGYIYYNADAARATTEPDTAGGSLSIDTIINNDNAKPIGRWVRDNQIDGYYGRDYLHDLNLEKGFKSVEYHPSLDTDNYEVYAYYPSYPLFADNVPVLVHSALGIAYVELNQQLGGGTWNYIGAYTMNKSSYVSVENFGTTGLVVADAFMFRRISFYSSPYGTEELANGTIMQHGEQLLETGAEPEKESIMVSLNMAVNSTMRIDLLDYFDYLSYITYNSTNGTSVLFNDSIAVISPLPGFNGNTTVTFDNSLKVLNFRISVVKAKNATVNASTSGQFYNVTEAAAMPKQSAAEIGKPVRWSLDLSPGRTGTRAVDLPADMLNITVVDEKMQPVDANLSAGGESVPAAMFWKSRQLAELDSKLKQTRKRGERAGIIKKIGIFFEERSLQSDITALEKEVPRINVSRPAKLELPNVSGSLGISYETAPPMLNESGPRKENFSIRKNVTVYSNASVHYRDVLSYTTIPESRKEQVHLYWKINNTRVDVVNDKRFNVSLVDTNSNGLIDRIEWLTPRLSEEEFEVVVDLTVLNVQSYPTLYNNWTVFFDTIGLANLTISTVNGTSWTEFLSDNTSTHDDLMFLDLFCGNDSALDGLDAVMGDGSRIAYSTITGADSYRVKSLLYENWECNYTAHLEDRIITTGKHHLMFEFGNDVEYANNLGYLLHETFDSYANGSDASSFVDYNWTGVNSYVVSDVYSVYKNASGSSFYTANVSDGDGHYSEYNGTNVFGGAWKDYEVRTKLRMGADQGTWGIGLILYSQISDGDANKYYIQLRAREGVSSNHFKLDSDQEGLHPPDGTGDSGVVCQAGRWYDVKAQVTTEAGPQTRVVAKIWPDNGTEPSAWQINETFNDFGAGVLTNGSVGLWTKDTVGDFDYLFVENMSSRPMITIISPQSITYPVAQDVWFNISLDKTGKNCTFVVNGSSANMTKLNDTFFYANQSFGTYGQRMVWFFCDDYFGNRGNASRLFDVGSGKLTIITPPNATIDDITPYLNATFNATYDTWYSLDGGSNSSVFKNTNNLTIMLGPLSEGPHKVTVWVNDSGVIDHAERSFDVQVPPPNPTLIIEPGNPPTTGSELVDLRVSGGHIDKFAFSCNMENWTKWFDFTGGSFQWYLNFNITNTSIGCNNSDGLKYVYVNTTNVVNESNWTYDTIILDNTPPLINLEGPLNQSVWQAEMINFTFNTSDKWTDVFACKLYINGSLSSPAMSPVVENITRTFSRNVSKAPMSGTGYYRWRVYCEDNTTNSNYSVYWYVTVDIKGPDFNQIDITPSVVPFNKAVLIRANVTDDNNVSNVWLKLDTPYGTEYHDMNKTGQDMYEYNFTGSWIGGQYNITLYANDTHGWLSTSSGHDFNVSVNASMILKTASDSYTPNTQVNLTYKPENWWNNSWNYRFEITAPAGQYNRSNYPVELAINFTDKLDNGSCIGCVFDNRSIRVIEYDSAGDVISFNSTQDDVPYGFAQRTDYNNQSNAAGYLTWFMNGTTLNGTTRWYYVYFDAASNGAKPARDYGGMEFNPLPGDNIIYGYNNGSFGKFEWTYDSPVVTTSETFYGEVTRVTDIDDRQHYAGTNNDETPPYGPIVGQSQDIEFEINQSPYFHFAFKAPSGTTTCLFVYLANSRTGGCTWNVIGCTPSGDPGGYTPAADALDLVDDNEWHSYEYGLDSLSYSWFDSFEFWDNSGAGSHNYYFDDFMFLQEPVQISQSSVENVIGDASRIDSDTSFEGYLTINVQNWTGTGWNTMTTVVSNQSNSTSPYLFLQPEWLAGGAWDTDNHDDGWYRVYAEFTDPAGNVLLNASGSPLNATYNFSIDRGPNINSVWADPSSIGYGENVTIKADVTYIGEIDSVWTVVDYPNGSSYMFNMSDDNGDDVFEVTTGEYWSLGKYNFSIYTNDTGGFQENSTGNHFNISSQVSLAVATEKDVYYADDLVKLTGPFDWANDSWHYRFLVVLDSAQKDRSGALIKHKFNITQQLASMGISGTFDNNSVRVVEYRANGSALVYNSSQQGIDKYAVPYGYFEDNGYDALSNAEMILQWVANGTTTADSERYFMVYYDITPNGYKDTVDYGPIVPGSQCSEDYIISSDNSGNIYYIKSVGDGTFGTQAYVDDVDPAQSDDNAWGNAIADFDNDGDCDFVVGDGYTQIGQIKYYQKTGAGNNFITPGVTVSTFFDSNYAEDFAQADFDHDGNMDVLVCGRNNDPSVLMGNGDGTFMRYDYTNLLAGTTYGKDASDIDNDGNIDLVYGLSDGRIYWNKGNGDGTFGSSQDTGWDVGNTAYGLCSADFNNDGFVDICAAASDGIIFCRFGYGNGTFDNEVNTGMSTASYAPMDAFDFNRDGNMDIVANNYGGERTYYYIGHGDGTFESYSQNPIGAQAGAERMGISAPPAPEPQPVTVRNSEETSEATVKSSAINKGEELRAYTYIVIQNLTGSGWSLVNETVNEGSPRHIAENGFLDLRYIFDSYGDWNTTSSANGTYRVYVELRFPNGSILVNNDGSVMNASHVFSIDIDNDGPNITSAVVDPNITGYGEQADISAVIIDAGSSVDAAWMNITYPDNSSVIRDMSQISTYVWQYSLNDTWQWGDYNITIFANDSYGYMSNTSIILKIRAQVSMNISTLEDVYYPNQTVKLTSPFEWWNTSWHYRLPYYLNETSYARYDALMGQDFNFSEKLLELGLTGTLDNNSIRVIEYSPNGSAKVYNASASGSAKYEVPISKRQYSDYNAISNAVINIRWNAPNTTAANKRRYFMVYFDITEYGYKDARSNTRLKPSDGSPDSVVAAADDYGRMNVAKNDQDGTFGSLTNRGDVTTYGTDNSRGIILGDFDNDLIEDIIIGSRYDDTGLLYNHSVYFCKGNGDLTFQSCVEISNVTSTNNNWVADMAVGDFNNDYNLDFVVSCSNQMVDVFFGNGDGTFEKNQTFSGCPSGAAARGKDAADIDNDGDTDVVVACQGNPDMYKLVNDGTGQFSVVQITNTYISADPYGLALGDFDEDGNVDILQSYGNSQDIYFYKGNGDGTFQDGVNTFDTEPTVIYDAMDSFDLDNDGHLDLIISGYNSRLVQFYKGNGDGSFDYAATIGSATGNVMSAAVPYGNIPFAADLKATEEHTNLTTPSVTRNTGSVPINARLLMQVHYWNISAGQWKNVNTTVNDTGPRHLAVNDIFDLKQAFADGGNWYTDSYTNGTYRIYAALLDPYGIILRADNGSLFATSADIVLNTSHNFSLQLDTEGPTVNYFTVSPVTTGYGQEISLQASIEDVSGVNDSWINVTYPQGQSVRLNMSHPTTLLWSTSFNDTWQWGNYSLVLHTSDNLGYNSTANATVRIRANTSIGVATLTNVYYPDQIVKLTSAFTWWDADWNYRKKIILEEKNWVRKDALISETINISEELADLGLTGSFDNNSIRIIEYDAITGQPKVYNASATGHEYEIPYEFSVENSSAYDKISNAVITLDWVANGTITQNEERYYMIYFDIEENGYKDPAFNLLSSIRKPCTGPFIKAGNDIGEHWIARINGDGTFGPQTLALTGGDNLRDGGAISDFDNDGDCDIIYADDDNNYIYLSRQLDNGSFSAPEQESVFTQFNGYEMATTGGDFNNDGNEDFIASGQNNDIYLFTGDGTGSFTRNTITLNAPGTSRCADSADLNNDGNEDFIWSYTGNNRMYIFLGDGQGGFTQWGYFTMQGPDTDPYGCTAADFDNDGNADIIANTGGNGELYLYLGDGQLNFTATTTDGNPIIDTNTQTGIDNFDLDSDGWQDLIITNWGGQDMYYYKNNHDNTFSYVSTPILNNGAATMGAAAPTVTGLAQDTTGSVAEINAQSDIRSALVNTGSTTFRSYTRIEIDYWNYTSSIWKTVNVTVDDLVNSSINDPLASGGLLSLKDEFENAGNWNTSNSTNGTYRVYVSMRDIYNNTLLNDNGTEMNATYNFTVMYDVIGPNLTNFNMMPNYTGYGNNITIEVDAIDASGTDNISINITYANKSVSGYMEHITTYRWRYEFTDTWYLGRYNVTLFANDTLGYNSTAASYFIINSTLSVDAATMQDVYFANESVELTSPFSWWNTSWNDRQPYTLTASSYAKPNIRMITKINFTELLKNLSVTGIFDLNSIRIVEYNSDGSAKVFNSSAKGDNKYLVPFKFTKGAKYSSTANAAGLLEWVINGTTAADQEKYFMVYFDIEESGLKPPMYRELDRPDAMIAIAENDGSLYYVPSYDNDTFGPMTYIDDPNPGFTDHTWGMAVADFDNDGDYDIMTGATKDTNYAKFYLYENLGGFVFNKTYTSAPVDMNDVYVMDMATGDFNNDGYMDVVAGGNNNYLYLFLNNKNKKFSTPTRITNTYSATRGKDAADIDGDGNYDFVMSVSGGGGDIYSMIGDGEGGFTQNYLMDPPGGNPYCIALGDFDNDGTQDLIYGEDPSGAIVYFYNGLGDGTFNTTGVALFSPPNYQACDAYDFNDDGNLDLAMVLYTSNEARVYYGNGDGTFNTTPVTIGSPVTSFGIATPEFYRGSFTKSAPQSRAESVIPSRILNMGDTQSNFYLNVWIEQWNNNTKAWDLFNDTISNSFDNVLVNSLLNLKTEFAAAGNWNTTNSSKGWYRLHVELYSAYNTTLSNWDGTLQNTTYNFSISADNEGPDYTNVIVEPNPDGYAMGNITLQCDVSDDSGVDTIWVNVTLPDNSSELVTMSNSSTGSAARWRGYFNDTWLYGNYTVRFMGNDTNGFVSSLDRALWIYGNVTIDYSTKKSIYYPNQTVELSLPGYVLCIRRQTSAITCRWRLIT